MASTATVTSPSSSVPDAFNHFIYFTAVGPNGPGVFKASSPEEAVLEVFAGLPFSAPTDLALSTDNRTIFVADTVAGRVFSLAIGGGDPAEVPGTVGTAPAALDVIQGDGEDRIYYCGVDAADGLKAVFEIPVSGGAAPTLRYKGAPLVSPTGIVSSRDGTLFIADAGIVYRLSGRTLTRVAGDIVMGFPAGIALTPDERSVVVSSSDPVTGKAQALLIDLLTGNMSVFTKVIGANSAPAGLHAARNAQGATGIYGWADRTSGVYRLER